ncbi:sigma-70 family RNA polymerase sigma factor [Haloferula sp.]|uniref:sigma-70 family RNA polymerase sigma factor n=1 Tax=Haloferula sp. TaxID=2497595 RepID=UPI00329F373E
MTANATTDRTLALYMREISKTDLLTREEEVELAERIQRGDKEARTHMINANLRLVVKIAKSYAGYGLPLSDLISEGNIGLMTAIDRYDPEKGAKLSSYASWWIKQSVKRALANQGKTIRLPIHAVEKITRIRRITTLMTEALGREPSNEELSEETGIPIKKLTMIRQAAQRPTSLDAPLSEGEQTNFGDVIGDESALSPLESLTSNNLHEQLDGLLDLLDERESHIINSRFGLNGKKPMNLEEVGREFGVTRERIRQLQNKALEKMRYAMHRKDNPLPSVNKARMS